MIEPYCNSLYNTRVDDNTSEKPPTSASKREDYLSWDDYFMSVAFLSSMRSKVN